MASGKHPVCVPEILHALATCPSGARPVPVKDSSPEMRGMPVVVVLHDNGHGVALAPASWVLIPHSAAKGEDDRGPAHGEVLGRLVFHVNIPPGWTLTPPPAQAPDEAPAEAVADTTDTIPEFAGVDPGVFAVNPDAINRGLRDTFGKGRNPDSNKEVAD